MTKTSLITIYLGEVRVAPIKKMTTETCLRIRWIWWPSTLLQALVEWKII